MIISKADPGTTQHVWVTPNEFLNVFLMSPAIWASFSSPSKDTKEALHKLLDNIWLIYTSSSLGYVVELD